MISISARYLRLPVKEISTGLVFSIYSPFYLKRRQNTSVCSISADPKARRTFLILSVDIL